MITVEEAVEALYTIARGSEYKIASSYTVVREFTLNPTLKNNAKEFVPDRTFQPKDPAARG